MELLTELLAPLQSVGPALVSALGPDWLNPETLLTNLGDIAFWVVLAIIFAECGLLIGFFLPGDSLLFVTGLFIAQGFIGINIWLASLLLIIAAFVGNAVGYWIGAKTGPALFRRPDSKLFKQVYVDKTHAFFEKYGARAIVMARFVPIVRTFAPFVAGMGRMFYPRFMAFSGAGSVLWICSLTYAGYAFGNLPFIRNNLSLVIIGIVLLSIAPGIVEYLRARRGARTTG